MSKDVSADFMLHVCSVKDCIMVIIYITLGKSLQCYQHLIMLILFPFYRVWVLCYMYWFAEVFPLTATQ